MWGSVHPQSGLLCGAVSFFSPEKQNLCKKLDFFYDFQMIFHQNGPDLQLNRRTINETGILDPIEF